MNLRSLTDAQLLTRSQDLVASERKITADAIKHFFEIERRRLYLREGYNSLYSMLTRKYLYCPATAMLRRNAVKLMTDVPDVIGKIESGAMPVTVVANIQSFLNAEAKLQKPYSQQAKVELVETCLGKSVIEVQKEFARRNPELEKRESVRTTSDNRLRVSHSISISLEDKLKRIKMIWSSVDPNMSREDLLDRMAEITLDQIDPLRKATRAEKRKDKRAHAVGAYEEKASDVGTSHHDFREAEVTIRDASLRVPEVAREDSEICAHESWDMPLPQVAEERRTRYIKAEDDRQVRERNSGTGCEFINTATRQRCGSHFQLQRDHIHPYSEGGANTADNLRLYCANHNRWSWRNRTASRVEAPQLKYG